MVNNRNRSRTEIVSQILEIAANGGDDGQGATKAKIMYNAFLNYEQLKAYLILLTQNDLLYYDKAMRTFKTTEKGLLLLQAYNKIGQMLKAQQN
jgi:predicted transcriptional regulator